MIQKASAKQVDIEFITFEDFKELANGRDAFEFEEHSVTKENEECYIIPTLLGLFEFTPEDILLIDKGELYPYKKDDFEMTYDVINLQFN